MEVMRSMPAGQTIGGEPERRGDERSEAPRSGGSPMIVRDAALTPSRAPTPRSRLAAPDDDSPVQARDAAEGGRLHAAGPSVGVSTSLTASAVITPCGG